MAFTLYFIIMICVLTFSSSSINNHGNTQTTSTGYSFLVDTTQKQKTALRDPKFTDGLVVGGSLSLAIALLFFYLANGSKTILLLCGYFLIRTILLSLLLDIGIVVALSESYLLAGNGIPLMLVLSDLFLLCFTLIIFKLKDNFSHLFKVLMFGRWILLLYLPISLLLDINAIFYISIIIDIIINACLVVIGLLLAKKHQSLAISFTLFVFIQLSFAIVNGFALVGLNNILTVTTYIYSVFFWLSCFIGIFILSREYYNQLQDREVVQQQVLANAKISEKAQKDLLLLQEENQELLESRVQERTLELNIALQELETVNKELAEINTLDELTGLYNRRHYDQKIIAEHRRSRRNLTPLSLVVIDIDHFKAVNDNYGHLIGDQCIVWLARKIKQSTGRSSDTAYRYGGEEFCLILPETDTVGAIALAEELRLAVNLEPLHFQEHSLLITISCGVSTYQQQPDVLPEQLFSAADKALYIAKDQGRNQVQQYTITHKQSS